MVTQKTAKAKKRSPLLPRNIANVSQQRRTLLTSGLGLLVSSCAGQSGFFNYTLGAFPCYDDSLLGAPGDSITLYDFEDYCSSCQSLPELCWAAAIAAIMNYHGYVTSELDIVEKVRGPYSKKGFSAATIREIIKGISGKWTTWYVNNGNAADLVQDLNQDNPVLVGISGKPNEIGHIIVVYGAEYVFNPYDGRVYIEAIDAWDPWCGHGFTTLYGEEICDSISFALHAWNPV